MSEPSLEGWIRQIAGVKPAAFESPEAFAQALSSEKIGGPAICAAAIGGALADRLGYAFLAGYQSATRRLVAIGLGTSAQDSETQWCLAATESRGVQPKALLTTLTPRADGALTLDGTKTFVTLADVSDQMLVVARRHTDAVNERPSLVLVSVPMGRAGVSARRRNATPFAPEIPHSEVRFEGVIVADEEIFPGDGYADYLKPFRTIEDLHVLVAAAGYLFSASKRGRSHADVAPRLVSLLTTARALSEESPLSPAVHVALAAVFADLRTLYQEVTASLDAPHEAERFRLERDAPLLVVAESARQKRLEAALALLEMTKAPH